MKLKVPFYKSQLETDCGPVVLKMVLEFLGEKHSIQELSKKEKQLDSGLVWSLGIARAAKLLGFPTKLISITNFSHEENIEFYEKYKGDKGMLLLEKLKKEVKEMNIEIKNKDLSLKELLSYVSENSVPIVLVNWYSIVNKKGFTGHFLPITGHDSDFVYVHNPGLANAMPYLPIKKSIFVKA